MKKIKPVVLKNTTRLTNSQMKEIRGGVTGDVYPTSCTVYCNLHTGALVPEITNIDCQHMGETNEYYCVVEEGIRVYCQSRISGKIQDGNPKYSCQYPNTDVADFKLG